jgi:hypothetical protein
MIVVDNNCYRVNPSIRTSPLVEGKYRLYFGDRTTSLKLSASEWEAISDYNSRDGLFDDLFNKCSEFFDPTRAGISRDDYLDWLCTHGILLSVESPTISAQVPTSVLQANELNGHSNQLNGPVDDHHHQSSQIQDRKILLVDFGWITSRGLLRPPRVLIRLQAWIFPLVALLFIGTIHSFYFGVKPLGVLIAERSDPLTGLSRLFIMLIVINMISVMASILSTYSMSIDDQKLYLKLKWGFLPRLAKEQSAKAIKQTATKLEELILVALPLLIRSYLVILSILFLYVYTPIPDSSPFSRLNILVAIIQGSLASMIILLIPVRNTPGRKLLEFFGVMPKNYLRISVKRATTIFSHLFRGRFKSISISRSDVNSILFLCTLLLAFIAKLLILYFILIPNISAEIPTFAGHWTSLIVRVALTLLLIRFLYLTIITKLINKRNEGRTGKPINRATNGPALLPSSTALQSTESIVVSSSTLSSISVHNRLTTTFKSKYFLPFILVVIFLFPFSASVTGSANVTEGEALDIRATEAATVRSIFQVGPSSAILDKGSKILELFSPTLSTQRSQQIQLISKLESDIRTRKSLIRSIKTGSIKLEGDNRNEELLSARAMVQKSHSRIRALENQIKIQDDQIAKLRELTKSGAISEFQLQNLLSSQAALTGELEGAQSELKSANADVIVARRKQTIDQDINSEEQLSKAMDELSAAESSLKVGKIALEAIDSRLAKLVVTMPFDGVISSNTRALLGRTVTTGETIVTVKAQPLTQTVVLIPEYDRARVRTNLPCILRLYSVSNEEFKGSVSSISPTTVEIDGLQYVELQIQLEESLPTNFIGSKGYAKIDVGFTCILFNLLAPVTRFVNVDLWSLLP